MACWPAAAGGRCPYAGCCLYKPPPGCAAGGWLAPRIAPAAWGVPPAALDGGWAVGVGGNGVGKRAWCRALNCAASCNIKTKTGRQNTALAGCGQPRGRPGGPTCAWYDPPSPSVSEPFRAASAASCSLRIAAASVKGSDGRNASAARCEGCTNDVAADDEEDDDEDDEEEDEDKEEDEDEDEEDEDEELLAAAGPAASSPPPPSSPGSDATAGFEGTLGAPLLRMASVIAACGPQAPACMDMECDVRLTPGRAVADGF